jgi:hypothetical protein
MTERELAAKFTEPNPEIARVRRLILEKIEQSILRDNQLIAQSKPEGTFTAHITGRRNGLAYAAYVVRDLIDSEGKILKEDLSE